MIRSFADKRTAALFRGLVPRGFDPAVVRRAQMRLAQLDGAASLDDLRVPPSNRLEALGGDRQGQFSIRINRQWRLCFVWREGDAYDALVVDYH